MPVPTLVATAGAANANSFCTVAEATAYNDSHLYSSAWENAENDQKIIACIWATRILDSNYAWKGIIASSTQALQWPRYGVLDRNNQFYLSSTTIPQFLINATAELARLLIEKDRLAEIDDQVSGIKAVTADVVSVQFSTDLQDKKKIVPDSVYMLISWYLEGSKYSIPLVRG